VPVPDPLLQEDLASKPTRRYRTLIFQSCLAAAILGFALLALLASTSAYFPVDLLITRSIQSYHGPWLDLPMRAVSWPGYMPQSLGIVGGFFLFLAVSGFRQEGRATLLAAVASGLLNTLAKIVIQRPRPSADLVNVVRELSSYSFPSGHVMFYTAFFGFLFFLCFSRLKPSWKRASLLALFGGLVALVGPSRIYVGEHWASDVFGAYLLGSLILLGIIQTYRLLTLESSANGLLQR
jgi:undecaprenyl-diphosphatase